MLESAPFVSYSRTHRQRPVACDALNSNLVAELTSLGRFMRAGILDKFLGSRL